MYIYNEILRATSGVATATILCQLLLLTLVFEFHKHTYIHIHTHTHRTYIYYKCAQFAVLLTTHSICQLSRQWCLLTCLPHDCINRAASARCRVNFKQQLPHTHSHLYKQAYICRYIYVHVVVVAIVFTTTIIIAICCCCFGRFRCRWRRRFVIAWLGSSRSLFANHTVVNWHLNSTCLLLVSEDFSYYYCITTTIVIIIYERCR